LKEKRLVGDETGNSEKRGYRRRGRSKPKNLIAKTRETPEDTKTVLQARGFGGGGWAKRLSQIKKKNGKERNRKDKLGPQADNTGGL